MYVHFAEERVIVFISFLKGSGTGKQLRAIPAQVKGPKLPRLNKVWLVSLHFLPLAKDNCYLNPAGSKVYSRCPLLLAGVQTPA